MIQVFTEWHFWIDFQTDIKNNIHASAIEMYKVANDMSPDIINEVFKLWNTPHYNLRHTSHFSTDPIHSVYNGTESASYLGPKICDQIPERKKEIKKGNLLGVHVEFRFWQI